MKTAIIGAAPTGLYTAIALARRGHKVTVVDRDAGPHPDGSWPRRGVMQFHHPHFFRVQVLEALQADMPEVCDDLLREGAEPAHTPAQPDQPEQLVGLRCRRMIFERVLRAAAQREPGVALVAGHVQQVSSARGRATGIRVDGASLDVSPAGDAI